MVANRETSSRISSISSRDAAFSGLPLNAIESDGGKERVEYRFFVLLAYSKYKIIRYAKTCDFMAAGF